MNKENDQKIREASDRIGALDRLEAIQAEVYWRVLQIGNIKKELQRLNDETIKLKAEYSELLSKYDFKKRDLNEWIAICEAKVQDKISVPDMIQTLLWERWYEGMTSAEIIRDIMLRWGRFHQIKETTIRTYLKRLQKSDKGYYKAGGVMLHKGQYEHWNKPDSYWPFECTYKPPLEKL